MKIGEKQQCVAEYLNRCVGGKKVVNLIQDGEITYYIFENGYELPLLCSCCGTPLVISELDKFRCNMRGRRLESMSTGTVTSSEGGEFLQFQLEFSKKGLEVEGVVQGVAPESAAKMRRGVRDKSGKFFFQKKRNRQKGKRGFGE